MAVADGERGIVVVIQSVTGISIIEIKAEGQTKLRGKDEYAALQDKRL